MFNWRSKVSRDGSDRRTGVRARVLRPVFFERLDLPGRLQRGETRDLSANGARIVTRQPLPVGARVNVELPPDSWEARHDDTQLVEGSVVRTAPDGSGATAMGVAFHQPAPAPNLLRRPLAPTPQPAHQLFLSLPPAELRPPRKPKPAPVPWRRAAALAVATFLLFLLGLWSASRIMPLFELSGPAHAGTLPASHIETTDDTTYAAEHSSAASLGQDLRPTLGEVEEIGPSVVAGVGNDPLSELAPPTTLLTQAEAALATGADDNAAERFARVSSNRGFSPVERFRAKLGQAQAAARLDHRGRALHFARDAQTIAGVPTVWQQVAAALEAALQQNLRSSTNITFEEWNTLMPFETADSNLRGVGEGESSALQLKRDDRSGDPDLVGAAASPLRLEVDRSEYVLRVLRDGAVVQAFPVGLGRDGRTPLGAFVIANKLRDPDWYDHGRTVPHGDPENPLGSRWMGLGDDRGATSYGLHPTDNPADLGAPVSAGCIRLRPSDAEALYRLCPVGTPVDIVD